MAIKSFVKRRIPFIIKVYSFIIRFFIICRDCCQKKYIILTAPSKHKQKLMSLQGKRIKCVLMVFSSENFRELLYKKLIESGRFDVSIVVCPIMSQELEYREKRILSVYRELQQRGYLNTVLGYDFDTKAVLDIKREFNPDIIFFTSPYRSLIGEQNYITKFQDALSIYIPYFINNTIEYSMTYDELLHNAVWRYYVETDWHKNLSRLYSSNKSRNIVVSGYPGLDKLLDKNYVPNKNYWKSEDRKKKRIIWAPHQTINPIHSMYYSAFLLIADNMVQLANKYNDDIEIAFKPHPLLINNLYNEWGKEKAEEYYKLWRNMPNTCLVEGDYVDLFLTSDAIIHDSASFITEYLILNKPALRTYNGRDPKTQFNDFGLACLDNYYKAYSGEEVDAFILNVIHNIDPMKDTRTQFIKDNLIKSNGKLPSEIIIEDILDSIDNQVLYRN